MTTSDRIEEQSFCYDPDFPPDVAEGLPLSAAAKPDDHPHAPVRRALKACGNAAAAVARRSHSSDQ
jgi:hypothetical protein